MALSKAINPTRVGVVPHHLARQQGLALIVVLLFLVLVTGVGVWGVKQSLFSEQVARNQLDNTAAREAAETALRDAERDLMNPSSVLLTNASCSRGAYELIAADFTTNCARGLCVMDDSVYPALDWSTLGAAEVWWPFAKGGKWNNELTSKPSRVPVSTAGCDFTGGVPLGTFTGAAPLKGVSRQPEYIVEYFRRKNVRLNLPETQVTSTGRNANQWSAMYRVTARGFGYSEKTQVVLQTVVFP